MFKRSRLAGVAAAAGAALALLTGSATASAATVATAASASAAKPAKAANPFALTLQHVRTGRLMPGDRTRSFEFSVTNRSSKPQTLNAMISVAPHGAYPLGVPNGPSPGGYPEAVTEKIQTVRGAAFTTWNDYGGKGWTHTIFSAVGNGECCSDLPMVLPAHATYTWKLTYGAAKTWPRNDDRLNVGVKVWAGSSTPVTRTVSYQVGTARTGGPVLQKLTGPSTLHNGQAGVYDYAVTNRTGAPLVLGRYFLRTDVFTGPFTGVQFKSFEIDVWDGHRWVPGTLEDGSTAFLRTTAVTIANGATLHLRFRLTARSWTGAGQGTATTLSLEATYLDDYVPGEYIAKPLAFRVH